MEGSSACLPGPGSLADVWKEFAKLSLSANPPLDFELARDPKLCGTAGPNEPLQLEDGTSLSRLFASSNGAPVHIIALPGGDSDGAGWRLLVEDIRSRAERDEDRAKLQQIEGEKRSLVHYKNRHRVISGVLDFDYAWWMHQQQYVKVQLPGLLVEPLKRGHKPPAPNMHMIGFCHLGYNVPWFAKTTPFLLSSDHHCADSFRLGMEAGHHVHGMEAVYFASALPPSLYQAGALCFDCWPHHNGERRIVKEVAFDPPFPADGPLPQVAAFLRGYVVSSKTMVRTEVKVKDITHKGVSIEVRTWNDTMLEKVTVSWAAFSPVPADCFPFEVQCGKAHATHDETDDAGQPWCLGKGGKEGQGEQSFDKTYQFPTPFAEVPQVTAAIDYLSVEHYVRVGAEVVSVSRRGFTVRFKTWWDTKVWGIGVGWIARAATRTP